jgi:hypothetical protein
MHRYVILLRIENLADLFDDVKVTYKEVNVLEFVDDLFRLANSLPIGSAKYWQSHIIEVPLTANQSLKQMQERKLKWSTEDSSPLPDLLPDFTDDYTKVLFQQQRIRSFRITYSF